MAMAHLQVSEKLHDFRPDVHTAVPGAGAVMNVMVKTDTLVKKPKIEVVFSGPILKAIVNAPDGNVFYENAMFRFGGDRLQYMFVAPPFDETFEVIFTVYSAAPVHVVDSNVESI
jgi:hypothetical protein